ncbi:alpha/beta hydrolase [Sphingomonas mali]|uniref:alpha/beta hydrolase n=1 Tax=Sphingomonas mali TaxID=40682 RepID=UPI00082F5B77|nr:alpha/beta hydrolase [Sphingomonas mali]
MDQISRRELASFGIGLAYLFTGGAAAALDVGGTDPMRFVSPEYKPLFPVLRRIAAMPPWDAKSLPNLRKPNALFVSPPPAATPPVVESMIPGPKGAPDVRAFVINGGAAGALKPAILHIHGGGFVMGSAKDGLRSLQEHAAAIDCVIVTIDYRLAPETRFPGALEDNYAGLKWLYAHAAELGVDRERIAVMGDSAGGGHAAMLAIAARDRGEVPLVYQVLIYPMLDDRTGSSRKMPPHLGQIMWRPADNRFGWTSLLGVPAGSARVPAGSVPARVGDLRGLPPAFIAVGSIDLFVDEDVDYARRLIDVGIPAELHVYRGAPHGFDRLPSETARQFNLVLRTAIKNAFDFAKK